MATMTCVSCRFFVPFSDPEDGGKCRRFPPSPVYVVATDRDGYDDSRVAWVTTEVPRDGYCGEWREY